MVMKLSGVVPFGRSFEEYVRMFQLSERDLQGKILGVGDGPASFNATATGKGFSVISIEISSPEMRFSRYAKKSLARQEKTAPPNPGIGNRAVMEESTPDEFYGF